MENQSIEERHEKEPKSQGFERILKTIRGH